MNTMMTADMENNEASKKREEEERNSTSAAMLLADGDAVSTGSHQRSIQNADGKARRSVKVAGGGILGALKFRRKGRNVNSKAAILQKAKEMQQWVVQRPPSDDDSSTSDKEEVGGKTGNPVGKGAADATEI